MRKLLLITASVAGLGLAMSAAQAADVVAPVEPEFSWTGFHIGVGGGGGWNLYDAESQFCHDDGTECEDGGIDPDLVIDLSGDDLGAFYGFGTVEAGFDYDFGGVVLGILANYDFNGDSEASVEDNVTGNGDDRLDNELSAELGDTWFLGARLGVSVGLMGAPKDSLIYILGGYTWADGTVKSEIDFEDFEDDHSGHGDVDEDDSVDGWTIGGGIETMLWEALSLKLEYRHDFLDDIDFDEVGVNDDGSPDFNETHTGSVDFSRDTVRAVLSWRFGSWW